MNETPDAESAANRPHDDGPRLLEIDLRPVRPIVAIRPLGDRDGPSAPFEIGHVNSPNSPTGATWAVEEIVEEAEERGLAPESVAVCAPEAWNDDERRRFDEMLSASHLVPAHRLVDGFATATDPEATQATPTVADPVPSTPPAQVDPSPATEPPATPPPFARTAESGATRPGPTGPAAGFGYADLVNLPHIDDAPLPEFVRSRSTEPSAPATPPTPQVPPSSAPASTNPSPPHQPPPSADRPVAAPRPAAPSPFPAAERSPERNDDRVGGRLTAALVGLFLVAVVGLAIFLLDRNGDDDVVAGDPTQTTAAVGSDDVSATEQSTGTSSDEEQGSTDDQSDPPSSQAEDQTTTTEAAAPAGAAAAPVCAPNQFPDPDIAYRVSDIPERFEAQTLNGRNVPTVVGVGGVESRVITEFPEFSRLALTLTDCRLNENGRPWWGVEFPAGPDGIAWASTLYIEPEPTDDAADTDG